MQYLILMLCFAVFLTGCGTSAKQSLTLRLGYGQPTSNPRHLAAEKFAQWIYNESHGELVIELFPQERLGTDKQMTEMAVTGTLDMVITAPGVLASYEPRLSLIELPFLFSSVAAAEKVLDGPLGEELSSSLPQQGLRLLAYWDNGFRHITNSRHPIQTLPDLKGLKIRVPENRMSLSIVKALGANPAPLPFPEVYQALKRKDFDGQENSLANIWTSELYQVQSHLAMTYHKYESTPLIISEKTWQKLTPAQQKLIKAGAVKFAGEQRAMNQELEKQIAAELNKKGIMITYPDTRAFRQQTQPLYDEWRLRTSGDLLDRIIKDTE